MYNTDKREEAREILKEIKVLISCRSRSIKYS